MIPLPKSHKSNEIETCDDASKRLGVLLAVFAPAVREIDHDLAQVLDAWADLSSAHREAVLAQLETSADT